MGVAEGTLRRWKAGVIGSLRSETRNALLTFLQSADGKQIGTPGPHRRASRQEDSEVERHLDAVEALDLSEREKIWKIVEIAATYRAKALADLAAALEREARVAEARTEAASAASKPAAGRDENARRRELVEEAVRTKTVPQELVQGRTPPDGSSDAQRAKRR